MGDSILFAHHLFDWCANTVKLPLMVATAFMKDITSMCDLLSKKYHRLSWSDTVVGWSKYTRKREINSAQLGETYKAMHGDCRVPTKYKNLRWWVDMQRLQYNFFHEGKKSTLNQQKIGLLDSIVFSWNIHKRKKNSQMVCSLLRRSTRSGSDTINHLKTSMLVRYKK